jgi:hypothetical protein
MRQVEYDYATEPHSSAIKAVYYNNKTKQLYVEFPGGRLAGYSDVTPDEVYDFVEADSVGSYYARHIKGAFRGINTDGIELVKQRTPAPSGVTNAMSSGGFTSSSGFHAAPKHTFKVTFTTVVTVDVPADTIAQAITKVEQGNPGAVVTEVKKV